MKARFLVLILALPVMLPAQINSALPPAGSVSLPVDEYNRLVDLASRPPHKIDAPPFESALKSAQINLRVGSDSVAGAIDLEGEVLSSVERRVPLVNGMIVLDAQQKGKPLPMEQQGGIHSALLSGPGEFAVTLAIGLPLSTEPGRASFQLPAPAAGSVRLALVVPGEETLVNLSPGLITSRASRDGQTWIEATLVPGQTANVWWAARLIAEPPVPPKETRFLSDVKTLISVTEAEVRVASLVEITVMQGEPLQFEVSMPEGYELTGASGATLVASDVQSGRVMLHVGQPLSRNHQFLISLVKANAASKVEVALPGFAATQRETGEVLVEGEGTIELQAVERGGLRRMDFKESSQYLLSMARSPVHAAFRYQKKPTETPVVTLEWVRFPDSAVLSAVAQKAEVTTLVTSEGRSLTEVKLTLKNQAQPFLKVALPAGASILSSEVAGEKVKPVQGPDGARVPLLRAGFHPPDAYTISFVFVHAGAPFEKKGGAELALPKMDVPVGLLQWEVFLPVRYKVEEFGGDAVIARLMTVSQEDAEEMPSSMLVSGSLRDERDTPAVGPGQIGGIITDQVGAVVPHARIVVHQLATGQVQNTSTDAAGRWHVGGVGAGMVKITVSAAGFRQFVRTISHDAGRGSRFSATLDVGNSSETVDASAAANPAELEKQQTERQIRQNAAAQDTLASMNVKDLQRRVVGVLPIAVNVPHTGNSYRFVRPLVVDEETTLTFRYKSK